MRHAAYPAPPPAKVGAHSIDAHVARLAVAVTRLGPARRGPPSAVVQPIIGIQDQWLDALMARLAEREPQLRLAA